MISMLLMSVSDVVFTMVPDVTNMQTCQPSRVWRDSPAFLPNVPRPAKSWRWPSFCTKAQFVTLPRCPDVNANHPIERNYGYFVRFLAKIPNGTAAESPCYSVFWNAIDFCRLYTSKKTSQCGPCQPLRFLPGKSRFFTRNVPLKHSPGWQV